MQELERLIELARKRLPSDFMRLTQDDDGWHLAKDGLNAEDLRRVTFEQVLAKLREWAGEPEPEPEPMTVAELMALRDRASKQLGYVVSMQLTGDVVEVTHAKMITWIKGTLDTAITKLTEWATPKLPEFTTLENVPVAWIQGCAAGVAMTDDARAVVEICRATMAKLQNLQHT